MTTSCAPVAPAAPSTTAVPASLEVLSAGVRAPLAGGGDVEYAALDYAASAPVLRRVWEEVAEYAPYYGSVHRGTGHLSRLSTELFERSRETVAAFLDCRPADQVVFTRSTTDSLNLLAAALPAGTRVFVFETEHHAALLPWARHGHQVTYLDAPHSPRHAVEIAESALAARPEAGGPALLCVTGASNVTGELWPVAELAAAAHRHGARIVLDAAQLAPHRPVSVRRLDVDWVAFSGHKLYAPFGAGVLAGRADWLTTAAPYLAGGGATRVVNRRTDGGVHVQWAEDEARHEAGSPNVIGAFAIAAACRALTEAGHETLVAHEQELLAVLREGLAEIPAVRELSLFGPAADRVAVSSFTVAGHDNGQLAVELSERFGIGVRSGMFCAQPLVRRLLGASAESTEECDGPLQALRVSFGAGTPREHVTRLVDAVSTLAG
ncbi:aminotransferase class V-fold PLP-dependent enzyme [Streptomyces millisiae]|uniref:Aminotransferase class V-fold PLP-dependent enzyme n=1 Tax=Streptomyces millisiae TaxID=3075542 RepID=A0ABU2LMQ4_9ACTN|nr:aminotransferase class V-fold PLP-dependent enzyme [Streptomyces sp. DSM 44918]MDT0318880.1 aminotransferase class V-fold PLP-dependent enzyme [Streptomyces sp. DSM 44918]